MLQRECRVGCKKELLGARAPGRNGWGGGAAASCTTARLRCGAFCTFGKSRRFVETAAKPEPVLPSPLPDSPLSLMPQPLCWFREGAPEGDFSG